MGDSVAPQLTSVVRVGDAAGGDLGGTYPNPTVPAAVKSGQAAGGDLGGTYPNPTVNRIETGGVIASAAWESAQILGYFVIGWGVLGFNGLQTVTAVHGFDAPLGAVPIIAPANDPTGPPVIVNYGTAGVTPLSFDFNVFAPGGSNGGTIFYLVVVGVS